MNAVLAVGVAFVLVPWLVVLVTLLGIGPADPTLVDDGLGPWLLAAVAGTALYAVVAVSVNLLVVRRTGCGASPGCSSPRSSPSPWPARCRCS